MAENVSTAAAAGTVAETLRKLDATRERIDLAGGGVPARALRPQRHRSA